jgi:hypothetical protein
LARIIEDAFTLELRWVSFTKEESKGEEGGKKNPFMELDQHPGTLAPVRFTFPARLVPNPSFNIVNAATSEDERDEDEDSSLQILTLSEAGYLYALTFPLDTLFYGIGNEEGDWSEEFKVDGLEGRTPVLMEGAEEGRVVVACSDGHSLVVEIADGSGKYTHSSFSRTN